MGFEQYFYIIGTTIFLPLWLWMFSKRDKRKDMLFVGLCFGIGAVIIEKLYANVDYWNPVYIFPSIPLEDFYYGFIFGGISSEIYEVLFNKENSKRRVYRTKKKLLVLFSVLTAFSFWLVVDLLKLNSIIAHIVPPLLVGLISGIIHKDIWKPSIINGIILAILTFIGFQLLLIIYPDLFINHWHLDKLSGILILSIPIEEILFAFSIGFGAANLFEVVYGYKVVDGHTQNRKIK